MRGRESIRFSLYTSQSPDAHNGINFKGTHGRGVPGQKVAPSQMGVAHLHTSHIRLLAAGGITRPSRFNRWFRLMRLVTPVYLAFQKNRETEGGT
jgi:hypothetical protein